MWSSIWMSKGILTYFLVKCGGLNSFFIIQITSSQASKLEEETRQQSSSKAWFVHRAGRITASNMKAASKTNIHMPSKSLIKRLCYPEAYKFSTKATRYRQSFICTINIIAIWPYQFRWGCKHEESAVQAYSDRASECHENLEIKPAGLYVDVERPYIGASPDRIITCTCCGRGCLEVKCPFCVKDGFFGRK